MSEEEQSVPDQSKKEQSVTFQVKDHQQCGGSYEEFTRYDVEFTLSSKIGKHEFPWSVKGTMKNGISGGMEPSPKPYNASGTFVIVDPLPASDTDPIKLLLTEKKGAQNRGYYGLGNFPDERTAGNDNANQDEPEDPVESLVESWWNPGGKKKKNKKEDKSGGGSPKSTVLGSCECSLTPEGVVQVSDKPIELGDQGKALFKQLRESLA